MSIMHPDFYRYFYGHWRFSRRMRGGDAQVVGEAEGQAEFLTAAAPYTLHYKESGQLRLAADQRVVYFSQRFDYQVADNVVHVAFATSREAYQSYRYDPTQKALLPTATHLCILDRYDGYYVLIDDDRFDLHTCIEGPHKHCLLHSRFSRISA